MKAIELKYGSRGNHSDAIGLPSSKSVALRAEVLSMIYSNAVIINDCSPCDDYLCLKQNLDLFRENQDSLTERKYCFGDGAAPLRFFLAYAAAQPNFYGKIDGSDQLRNRPLAPLVDALRKAGAKIEYLKEDGRLPVRVKGNVLAWPENTPVEIGTEISSQFLSALMMSSLIWEKPFVLPDNLTVVSAPYIEMTRRMIEQFIGFSDKYDETGEPTIYYIEEDWSAASYFYELVLGDPHKTVLFKSLISPEHSVQGDSACAEIFDKIGVKTEFTPYGGVKIFADKKHVKEHGRKGETLELNLRDTPDLVPAVVAGLCMAGIPFYIDGIGHLRHKESDRLAALATELAKAGYALDNKGESLAWDGKRLAVEGPVCFDSHGDHRMAMSLAVMAVKLGEVTIKDARCVSKSFPDFFNEIEKTGLYH